MSRKDVTKQITRITDHLIWNNFVISQNYPSERGHSIVWDNYINVGFTLKNENYTTIYNNIRENKDFNFLMLDGAIIQMQYEFYKDEIVKHILSFYPCPDFFRYADDSDYYETYFYNDHELFSDMVSGNILCAPIRFDFDNNDGIFVNVEHPKSHLTIGNYKDCRIPVLKPITPNRFIRFILRNFYYKKFTNSFNDNFFNCQIKCNETLSLNESNLIHISWI